MSSSELPADYGERVRQLRLRLGLSQGRLGELLGATAGTVSRWESGQLSPSSGAWRRIVEAEELGLAALLRQEQAPLEVRETTEPYGQPRRLDFEADPEVVRTVAEAHRLAYGHLFNPAFAAEVSLIEPLPHQRIAVYQHLLTQARIRFLLADDPGAGKTIMSGLLIREMLSRRLIRRVLVVPPAGLVTNWKREMRSLFRLPFEIVAGADARQGNPFRGEDSDLVIVSVDTLAGEKMFARLAEAEVEPYDIVFFDEAHKLSANRGADMTVEKTDRYKLAEALAGVPAVDQRWSLGWSAHHLILLTATPHMGRDYPYYALWRLLEPEIFGSMDGWNAFPREARRRYFLRRTKEEMVRYDGSRIYPKRTSDTFGCPMSPGEKELYDRTTEYIHAHYNTARILNRSAARLAMSVFQRRLTSSTAALLKSFQRRLARLDSWIEDIRSGRLTEADILAAQRRLDTQLPEPIDQKTADEEEGEENERIENRALGGVARVSISELQAERAHVELLRELAGNVSKGEDAKFERFRSILQDPEYAGEKILVFTEHKDTLDFIVDRLSAIGFAGSVAQIHGGMPYGEEANLERLTERQDNVEFFRMPIAEGGAAIMVCTDAAAEGINLQFCWLMVNYDIPWNPARLEQRMGRIHRFGQKRERVQIINLVSDPEKTREGRVLKTLLDKLEKIRKELGQDKVFDVVGRLLDGKTLGEYMAKIAEQGDAGRDDAIADLSGRVTEARVEDLRREGRERYGEDGEVERELPRLREQMEREARLKMMPGHVRRFVEKAAPMESLGFEGSLDDVFSLQPRAPRALDPLLPVMDTYPPSIRNHFSIQKPKDPDRAIFFHPGEPVFERLRNRVMYHHERDALRGAVFVDAHAREPYAFHLALVTVARRADPSLPALKHPEPVESRLVGLRQNGKIDLTPLEHLLLLKGAEAMPMAARTYAREVERGLDRAATAARAFGESLVEAHRKRVRKTAAERAEQLRAAYDYQEIELAAARTRLREKARAGDARAQQELEKVKVRQAHLEARLDEALRVVRREAELFDVTSVEMLVHALVVPTSAPEDRRRQDAEVERVAMEVVRIHEEAAGARVEDVHTPELAKKAGLPDFPGFDLLSLRPDGERDIEVKGRAGIGTVELSENEWARAATLRDRYWLYVVFDCATERPRLWLVRDPFAKLLMQSRTSTTVAAEEILRHSEAGEGGTMAQPSKPKGEQATPEPEEKGNIDKLLALIAKWQAEPGDYDERAAAVIDPLIAERRIALHNLDDWDWESWKEDEE
ncbi:helicase-related protein [Sorangium sp. So ce1128]